MVIILNVDDLNLIFMKIMKKRRKTMKIADEDVNLQLLISQLLITLKYQTVIQMFAVTQAFYSMI